MTWTDDEWEEMSAWERLTKLPEEMDRRSGRLDTDEVTSAGDGETIEVSTGKSAGSSRRRRRLEPTSMRTRRRRRTSGN